MITLYSSYVLVKDQHRNNETLRPALEEIEKLFKEPKTWRNANLIEQLLIPLLCDHARENEITRRLLDAKRYLRADRAQFYIESFSTTEGSEGRVALLSRLIDDLQWCYEVKRLQRYYAALTRIRTGFVYVLSFFVFLCRF